MRKANPIAMLAEQLVRSLFDLRDRGSAAYPTTCNALAALAAPEAAPDDLAKAFKKKPGAAALIRAHKNDPQSPISLAEDADRLAASPLLLEFALGLICTPTKPAHPLAAVVKKIDKALQPSFAATLERRLATNDWPVAVGVVVLKNKPQLYLKRLPPPPPPPATLLALKLLDALHGRQQSGGYPTTLAQLVQQADPGAPPDLVRQALKEKGFKPQVLVALANHLDSPLAFTADAAQLAASPLLLETVVAATRTAGNQAVPADGLAKKLDKALRQPFADNLAQRLDTKTLPPAVGCLRIKTKPQLFLWADAGPTPAALPPLPTSPQPSEDIGRRFEEAFARLDRENGSSNFVSLVALRRVLPVERSAFDAGLDELRRAGRYTLSGAEGRHGVSDEERDAGLREEGTLLLYVSRKQGG